MISTKEITDLCKSGSVNDAYEAAHADWLSSPNDVWAQRNMGWVTYYLVKMDHDHHDINLMVEHLKQLQQFELLSPQNDAMLFENILWKVADFVKQLQPNDGDGLTNIFVCLTHFSFASSKAYSYLLMSFLKHSEWDKMADFIDWWDLSHLSQEDYQPYVMSDGKRILSLAERSYIAYAKSVLNAGDKERIRLFIPQMETLMEQHPEMLYPGYFCGKMLLALGSDTEEAMKAIIPFAKKKVSEFWVWQLLGEAYKKVDSDKQLACLLRASHCKAKEQFIGKIRIQLASLYISRNDLARAKYHIDKVVRTYLSQGWRLPYIIRDWTRTSWLAASPTDSSDPIDCFSVTDTILYGETFNSLAMVTYIDETKKMATLVYGERQKASIRLKDIPKRVSADMLLTIRYVRERKNGIRILSASPCHTEFPDTSYLRHAKGMVMLKEGMAFVFLKTKSNKYFMPPDVVRRYKVVDKEEVSALLVLDYNKKKEEWAWNCRMINR